MDPLISISAAAGSKRLFWCSAMIARALFLVYLLVAFFFSASLAGDTLIPGQPLLDVANVTLISAGETFELGFFSPDAGSPNRYLGIWYHSLSPRIVVWVANRERPVAGRTGRLSLSPNGTLLVTEGGNSSTAIWSSSLSSGSPALASPVARLLDTGNFVVGEEVTSSSPAWESFGFPTDTLLPGMQLGVNTTSGRSTNITSWRSATDPAAGDYTLGIDWHGDPQLVIWRAGQKYWRAGPWNGIYITGAPQMDTENLVHYQLSVNSREFILAYTVGSPSVTVRITINSSGLNEILTWVDERQGWNVRGYVPLDPCDNYAPCGPNGVCFPNMSPLCQCLPKFHPANPTNWDLIRDWSGGCVRDTNLDCRNATDGFIKQTGLKLPDTSTATVDENLSTLDGCRSWCLNNCSCTAYASANVSGGGSGCIFWTSPPTDMKFYPDSGSGQDLYIRLAAADVITLSESNHSNRNRLGIIIGISCAAIFLLACVLILWKMRSKHHVPEEAAEGEDLDLPLFDLKSVEDATENFSIANKLGEGGYGPVYRGKLSEDQDIAVKRLSETSTQGVDEFKNEVILIAKLQHRNLVRLLGCCVQAGERMLIYEYLPNGSLDTFLFDKDKRALVDWKTRYNIIVGIARGLLYLHHDSRYRIIHRDLKASNILLDKDMNPKISDFGMARIFGGDETMRNTTRVVGTYGYMSPEYAMDGIFSVKSDVFSFGVLVLEIVTGKKNRGAYQYINHKNLVGHMWSLWKESKSLELVDESIAQSFFPDEVLRCIKVGLLCVQEQPEDRPTMSSVLLMLNNNSSLLPEPKPPGFVITKELSETETSTSKGDSLSRNHVSITILDGR
ncbi:G-type lectin S-receptor-like serine/threonine-protein kinase At4g27290 [Zingiber officinale]|uniref:G-type lectin S-receptor-like serine/threonine-protein kinase At4g27290 n=1 Tax=Zingiber officinale TaxID=94328 RepID=UPI001C4B5104|nr:G-type lectin S-receptor-like serine/threonine-protein kinase At4g27290 [Zingiber officinale]